MARAAHRLLESAAGAVGRGDELVQFEAVSARRQRRRRSRGRDVRRGDHRVDPTVGLIFYDLRTCLRALNDEEEKPKPRRRAPAKKRRTTMRLSASSSS